MKTTVKVGFKDLKFGAKETTLPLVIKGDLSDAQKLALINIAAAGTGFVVISSAQADIDDYDEEGDYTPDDKTRGSYKVASDGTVNAVQMNIDDVDSKLDGEPSTDELEIESMESEVSQEEREQEELDEQEQPLGEAIQEALDEMVDEIADELADGVFEHSNADHALEEDELGGLMDEVS
jgi:hypothetical protein